MTQNKTGEQEVREEASRHDVYHVSDKENGRSIWTKIGVAFINQDGSLNVFLDVLPLDGKLQIRKKR